MSQIRVASFARINRNSSDSDTNRPPSPLTMPPTARKHSANFTNGKIGIANILAQPKLILKPNHNQLSSPAVQTARISKEITAQTRSSSTPSPSYPKMKQIPMRKTPYSLRPDRAIPDLEAPLSPPPPAVKRANRKRRWPDQMSVKQPKYDDSEDEERNNSKSYNSEYDENYSKILQNVIDLSLSLRKMQIEMMRDFFNKQSELLEREHKFQMQQDHMIMKTFQDQTQEIMHSVKHLVGSIKTHADCQQKETKLNRKVQLPKAQATDRDNERELDQMLDSQCDDELQNEIEDDLQEYNEMEQDAEDMYTDDEQQEDQIDQEDIDNNANEEENDDKEEQEDDDKHSELSVKRNINGLSANTDDF